MRCAPRASNGPDHLGFVRPPRDDIAAIAAEFEDKTQSQVENYSCVFWVRSPGLQLQSGERLLQL